MTQPALHERARFDAMPRERSPKREVLLPFRTSRRTADRLSQAAHAAGMTRQAWVEATLLAAIPPTLHDVDDGQEPPPAA